MSEQRALERMEKLEASLNRMVVEAQCAVVTWRYAYLRKAECAPHNVLLQRAMVEARALLNEGETVSADGEELS
jgi:hypothetical protein